MSVWNRVRTLWESDRAIESTSDSLLFSFKRMRSQYPEKDTNAWLAWALTNRPGWGHYEKQELLLMAAPYAITPDAQATALLALDVVMEEHPELRRIASEKHRELYLPVDFAIKNGSFLKRWTDTNPWTNENFPSVERELKHGLLAGESSRAVDKVTFTCPQCRVELRIPSITGGKRIRCPKCSSLFVVEP